MRDLLLQASEDLVWGTYGKGAMEAHAEQGVPLPEVRWVRLRDCSTNHLKAIAGNLSALHHGIQGATLYGLAIQAILDRRRGFLYRLGELLCRKSRVTCSKPAG